MTIWPYIQIARPDHWFKNVFVLPGMLLVFFFHRDFWSTDCLPLLALGLVAVCLTASSNYVLNEVLDGEKDKLHPVKKNRPVPSGRIHIPTAYAEWILLGLAGVGVGWLVSAPLGLSCLALWIMGTVYNIPPVRTKELPYLDVLSESINNPLRMMIGWYATGFLSAPTLSILLAYWMFGAFLMAIKRLAEYRMINDPARAAAYRKSFSFYNEERLLESILYYASLFGMFSAVFMTRYRLELVLATPLVAYALAYYLHLGFRADSPVQYPELLYREKKLMAIVTAAFLACGFLLFYDIPLLRTELRPWHQAP